MTTTDEQPPQGQRTNSLILAASIGGGILILGWLLLRVFGAAAEGESVVSAFSPIFNFILEVARAIGVIVLFAMLVAWMVTRTEKKVPLLEKHIESLNLQLANAQQTIEMVQVSHATTLRERHQVEVDIATERRVLEAERKELQAMREALKNRKRQLDKRDAITVKPGGKSYAWGDVPAATDAVVAALKENPKLPIREAKPLWIANGGMVPKADYKEWAATFTAMKSLLSPAEDAPKRIVLQRGRGRKVGERSGEQGGEREKAEA